MSGLSENWGSVGRKRSRALSRLVSGRVRKSDPLGMSVLGVLGWAFIGAAIGYHAAPRRGFSRTSGVVSGAPWGALAVVLYCFDGGISLNDHRP